MLSIAPWDFLCRLRLGRAFENQVRRLDNPKVKFNFNNLPGEREESLMTRLVRISYPDCGPDLVEFVIYRPDIIYERFCRQLEPSLTEIEKIRKVKSQISSNIDSVLNNSWLGSYY